MEYKERVYQIVSDKLVVDKNLINDEADLCDDLGGDSLDVIEIVMEIESAFGFSIDDDRYFAIHKVGDLIKAVESHDKG